MEKQKMESDNIVDKNIANLLELFPNTATKISKDGVDEVAIDFDILKQELACNLVEGVTERYQFTWPGKKRSILLANSPFRGTLRPCVEESVDFENTKNLYIEGDNLSSLKLLRRGYSGKVKIIYIDPPYNTGEDKIYKDDYAMSVEEYKEKSGDYDKEGNRLVENPNSNGRFHTDWINMVYPRLKVAKDLLADDGVIFVSIDEREQCNTQKILDEIFGERNYISNCFVLDNLKGKTGDNLITSVGSRLLVYAKNKSKISKFENIENEFGKKFEDKYSCEDEKGMYNTITFKKTGQDSGRDKRPYMYYPILQKDGLLYSITQSEYDKIYDKENKSFNDDFIDSLKKKYSEFEFILPLDQNGNKLRWTSGFATFKKLINDEIFYSNGVMEKKRPAAKDFLQIYASGTAKSLFYKASYANGTSDFKKLFNGESFFDFPKPVSLMKDILKLVKDKNAMVLDFFSGSATMAQAVMQLNAEDGGTRSFIMVQFPVKCDENTKAYTNRYKTICEIGKDRIRKAGKIIKEDLVSNRNLDVGFRVLKLDSSNMEDVYYKPSEYSQLSMDNFSNSVKSDRLPMDILFQVLLDTGKSLSSSIEVKKMGTNTVYVVNCNDMICCFDESIEEDTILAIAKLKPQDAVFCDKSFANDSIRINAEQFFKTYSPDTRYRVI